MRDARTCWIGLLRLAALLWPLVLVSAPRAQDAAEPESTPFLMVDTDMHVGPIWRVAVDSTGSVMATASADKSIRLFDLKTGALLRKVHLPLGTGEIGAVISVALAPDGKRLLAATRPFDSTPEQPSGSIYLVDIEQGALLGRIRNLPAVPTRLVFAPDGRHFVAVMEAGGAQIRTASGRCVWEDPNASGADPVQGAAFAADGHLALLSLSGVVRLFQLADDTVGPLGEGRECPRLGRDPVADEIARQVLDYRVAGPLEPSSLSFSPSGDALAVSYRVGPAIDVIGLQSRAIRRLVAPTTLSTGNLAAVAWVRLGGKSWLLAGGTVQDVTQRNVVLGWQEGAGEPALLPVSDDSITDLVAAGELGAAVATTDPSWSVVKADAAGAALEIASTRRGERLDFREVADRRFAISRSGSVVEFTDRAAGGPIYRFDLNALSLEPVDQPRYDLAGPLPARGDLALDQWFLSDRPLLNGHPVMLTPGERVLAADVGPNRDRVVLGTDYRLRLLDRDGMEIASRELPTAAWGVAIVPERPLVVVAHGDGSIRWYSLLDTLPLAEVAGLFMHRDGRRWVAWTADGLFAHSDLGGESLVGFQQNGTRQAPTGRWLGFQQVYRLFYDPESVAGVLDHPETWPAIADGTRIRQLLQSLALPRLTVEAYCPLDDLPADTATRGLAMLAGGVTPVVTPDNPDGCVPVTAASFGLGGDRAVDLGIPVPPGKQAVRVKLRVENAGGGFGPIDAFVDGRNLGRVEPAADAASAESGQAMMVERTVPLRAGTTAVLFRAYDDTGVFAESPPLRFTVPTPPVPPQHRLFVFAAAVDTYGGSANPLHFAVKDAQTFVDTVTKMTPPVYTDTIVATLYDKAATRDAIVKQLSELAAQVKPEDALLIYLAGHGVADERKTYFFVPVNVTSSEGAAKEGLDHPTLVRLLGEIPAKNVFVLLDTCYAGAFKLQGPDELAHESGRLVLTASASVEEALDSYNGQNGVFAYAVQQGLLGGAADSISEEVDALQLAAFVRKLVPRLSQEKRHRQSAVFKVANSGDLDAFPIAMVPKQEGTHPQ